MTRRTYSGLEVVKFLRNHGYAPAGGGGSHRKLIYRHPDNPDDVRTVIVPLHDELATGTLRSIADQCDADDFQEFLDWLDSD